MPGSQVTADDLNAARDAAFQCLARVRAIVGLQPYFLPSWRIGITEALKSQNYHAIERVANNLPGEATVFCESFEGQNYHHLAYELALRAAIAFDNHPDDSAIAFQPFLDLDYRALAMRIKRESSIALRRLGLKGGNSARKRRPKRKIISSSPAIENHPTQPRLLVDLKKSTITLDGTSYDVSSQNALRWLRVLADHAEDWISSRELKNYDPELDGIRTDRLKLPEPISKLINSVPGKGSRLRL